MKNIHKDKKSTLILWLLFFTIIGAFLFSVNRLTPLSGEDFMLQPWSENSPPIGIVEKVKTTFHIMKFQASTWNARIGEMLSIVMGGFDKIVFDIINSLLVILLIIVIFVYGFGRFPNLKQKQDLFGLFIIFTLLITVFPLLGQIVFWKTGTTNHTWGSLFVLSFGVPFRLISSGTLNPKIKWPWVVLLVFFGFVAGMSIENASVAMFALISSFFLFRLLIKKKLPSRLLLPLLANLIGIVTLIFNPSTVIRRTYSQNLNYEGNKKGVELLLSRFLKICSDYFRLSWVLFAVLGVLIIVLFIILRKNKMEEGTRNSIKSNLFSLSIILFFSFLSNLILITIPYQTEQARGFAFNYFIMLALIAFISQFIFESISQNRIQIAVIIGIVIVLSFISLNIINTYVVYNKEVTSRNQVIDEQLSTGSKDLILRPLSFYSSRILETRETYLMNNYLNGYYQVSSIVVRNSKVELSDVDYSNDMLITIEENLQQADSLTVRGWMLMLNKFNFGSSKFLALIPVDGGSEFYFTTYAEYPRPDVAKYFKIPYISSGFTSKIDLTDIPIGEYKLGGIIKIGETLIGAISDKIITINR